MVIQRRARRAEVNPECAVSENGIAHDPIVHSSRTNPYSTINTCSVGADIGANDHISRSRLAFQVVDSIGQWADAIGSCAQKVSLDDRPGGIGKIDPASRIA